MQIIIKIYTCTQLCYKDTHEFPPVETRLYGKARPVCRPGAALIHRPSNTDRTQLLQVSGLMYDVLVVTLIHQTHVTQLTVE